VKEELRLEEEAAKNGDDKNEQDTAAADKPVDTETKPGARKKRKSQQS
jgi:hypothetical protein